MAKNDDGLSPALTFVFAVATGSLIANIYYAQALVAVISPALGLHASLAGLIVTITQLSFAAGLLLLSSLADLVENRRLILLCIAATIVGLCGAARSTSAAMFLLSSVVFGVGAVGAQIIVPLAAHLASDQRRGRVIGDVMAGLITGIMLSRPIANLISSAFGWRAVFGASAVLALAIFGVLWFALPVRDPRGAMSYRAILASTWHILITTPLLQRRAAYQAIMFAMFSLFWTGVPLVLSQRFGFDQRDIALFALAGAGGALAAPIAGRLADRGLTWQTSLGAMLLIAVSFALTGWAVAAGALIVFALAAIGLDAAMQTNHIVSQRVIYGIDPEARGRMNAVYMTSIFLAGAVGSFLAGVTYFYGGWTATASTGVGLGLLLLALFATESRPLDITRRRDDRVGLAARE
jgi:predicted MFS family arabinose efflux permease